MLEYILKFKNPNSRKIELTGGKGSSLVYLSSIEGISVPEGFCVSTTAYDSFISETGLDITIRGFDEDINKLSKSETNERAASLRADFLKSTIPDDIEESIKREYRSLCGYLKGEVEVAVRSSATTEDLENASFAGQHDTYLNVKGEDNIVKAVKKCWASFYTDRAINYRKESGFSQYGDNLKMSVVVQRMVDPQAAGVAFSVDQTTAYDGVVIEANYGLGESLVSGDIIPDRFVVHNQTLDIIQAQKGSKEKKIINRNGGGTETADVAASERVSYCLSFELVKKIADSVNKVQTAYADRTEFIDTEFAVDQNGKLYLLQARPATLDLKVITVDESALVGVKKIYEGGTRATRKAASGRINIIHLFEDLEKGIKTIESGDIVITRYTWNEWAEYLEGVNGLVTEQGGTLSHAAIISREWGVACIVGCNNLMKSLQSYNGRDATIDANRCSIYLGRLPLIEGKVDPKQESEEIKDTEVEKKVEAKEHVMKDGEGTWLGRPNYPLGKLQLELYLRAFEFQEGWLQVNPERKKIVDGVLYTKREHVRSVDQLSYSKRFKGMNIAELEEVCKRWEKAEKEYLKAADFLELTRESFENFIKWYTEVNCFMNIAFTFNSVISKKLLRLSIDNRMPRIFYEEALESSQAGLENKNKSKALEAVELGQLMGKYYQSGIPPIELFRKIEQSDTNLADRVLRYSQSYKFGKSDLRLNPPIENAMRLIIDSIKKGISIPASNTQEDITYYPEDLNYQRLLDLATKVGLKKDNFHHIKPRGQWKFRDKLLELGERLVRKGELSRVDQIFEMSIDYVLDSVEENEKVK